MDELIHDVEGNLIEMDKSAVAIFSGGLDSTTMLYSMLANGWEIPAAVSFYYGQKHVKELLYAAKTCEKLGIKHIIINLEVAGLTAALAEADPSRTLLSASDAEVPDGHYTSETMKATVVPNRNMIMLSIAGGIAVANNAACVATGVHQGDHFIYPDCRPEFIQAAGHALFLGNVGFGNMHGIVTPFLLGDKTNIAAEALQLHVPIHESWSCYKGDENHCGRCGTCVERLEAIHDARIRLAEENPGIEYPADETVYEDTEFWVEEVARVAVEKAFPNNMEDTNETE